MHYQSPTRAYISAKDKLFHEVDIEVFVKVRQIYFLACFGNVIWTEQVLVYYRLFLTVVFIGTVALMIFAFLRGSSIFI